MSYLKIINPGLLTTIQDYGRAGYQQDGMPVAGAMDSYAMQLANILTGNDRNDAVIEMTFLGAEIQFNLNTTIAITGADMSPRINGTSISMYKTVNVNKGDILKLVGATKGCRTYISISGGLDIPKIMGSKSTYLRAKIGGLQGRKLKAGDEIYIKNNENTRKIGIREMPEEVIPDYKGTIIARVILGPEDDRFTDQGIKTFFQEEYKITNQSDRMGYRLEGKKIEHKNGADIISGGITLGAIQVPGHGQPIIMMADRQTTGGYTKIANVISVDIPYLAQLKPGDRIRFKKITLDEAHKLIKQREEKLEKLINDFKDTTIDINGKIKNLIIKVKGKSFNVSVQEINK